MHRGTKATLSILALVIAVVAAFPALVSAAYGPTLTITTDTTLSADFTGHIIIGADGITLDCAGFSVIGSGASHGTGILLDGRTGVTVKNCHVTGFVHGLHLRLSSNNTLTGNTASDSVRGIRLTASNGNTLTGNTAHGNGDDGFILFSSSNNTLTGNAACDNSHFDAVQDPASTGNVWQENDFGTTRGIGDTPPYACASLFGVPLLFILIVVAGVGVLVAVVILARRGRSR